MPENPKPTASILLLPRRPTRKVFGQVARLFRAAAAAETVHAHAHLKVLGGINSTADNLKEAVAGETHEFKNMYPGMIADAQAEGHKGAERTFTFANEVEKIHAAMYEKALADPAGLPETEYTVCSVCGYTHEGEAPERCPICGAKSQAFFTVD